MSDGADYWNDVKAAHKDRVAREGWLSDRFKTEKDRQWHTETAYEAITMVDKDEEKHLRKLGLKPVHKGSHSFQITLRSRVGMYYCGRKGNKIRWNDGETVRLQDVHHYKDGLEEYLKSAPPKGVNNG